MSHIYTSSHQVNHQQNALFAGYKHTRDVWNAREQEAELFLFTAMTKKEQEKIRIAISYGTVLSALGYALQIEAWLEKNQDSGQNRRQEKCVATGNSSKSTKKGGGSTAISGY